MSYPTVLGPWYIVQHCKTLTMLGEMEYYTSMEDGVQTFQPKKKLAMLFMSLASAARVAASEGAEVRVLTSKEEAEEFGRS